MNDLSFRDGVDLSLDLADLVGGKVTAMMVCDTVIGIPRKPDEPRVMDLYVTIVKRRELPLNHIKLSFEAIPTSEPCPPANPPNQPPSPTPPGIT